MSVTVIKSRLRIGLQGKPHMLVFTETLLM